MWFLALVAAASLLLGCAAADDGDDVLPAAQPPAEPGFGHVHGLGVNPADDRLYAATHFGLWRVENGRLERVGDAYHDLMGFTVLGPDLFAASGHPLLEEDDLPPHLGYIVSDDAGHNWRSASLLGEVDFHALAAAQDGLYGYDASSQRLLHSSDGHEWAIRHDGVLLTDLVVDPADDEHLIAGRAEDATQQQLEPVRSRDGGRSWDRIDGPAPLRLAWAESDRLFAFDDRGQLFHSSDGGEEWEHRGTRPAAPGALLDHGDSLYAAAGDRIIVSEDDGASWQEHATAPTQ